MYASLLLAAPFLYLGLQVLLKLSRAIFSPLKDIPGPFWSRFTTLWYFNRARKGKFEQDNIHLHQTYGPVVRISPDQYSISEIDAIKTVYGPGSKFAKSAWYDGWRHPQQWSVFSDRNIKRHSETRKKFTGLYSMSSVVQYEPFVNSCIEIFFQRLDEFADQKQVFDLGHWFQCYAFDVIGDITFGQRFGFLDRGDDIDGAINAVHRLLVYSTLVGIYPEWHARLFQTLTKFKISGAGGRAYIAKFVREKIALLEKERNTMDKPTTETSPTQDFLTKMMQARDQDPEKVTDFHLAMMGQSNVGAGSDTTAISLSGIMWHLLKNPQVLRKLREEIRDFTEQGRCSVNITMKETQEMPYLQAVMKEALRLHPATGLPMWRVVPAGGAQLSGKFFPEGTVVGINAWVAHYNEEVFTNATAFRPERWLESETEPEKMKDMNQMYMPFGLGSRTCLGKHISILEMSKLIPCLVRDYDLASLRETLDTSNFWFVKPTNFDVRVSRRVKESVA
ncbi:hypothetical protein N7454_007994 [Penicillium verhagenii]|nr:hypothetical protein N7454_007994 [Penicillium verhagenii]